VLIGTAGGCRAWVTKALARRLDTVLGTDKQQLTAYVHSFGHPHARSYSLISLLSSGRV
jgi:hypothetical protein